MIGEARHRRSLTFTISPRRGVAQAPVPQQHHPHHRARVRLGPGRRRHQAADRRRARRRHGLAGARRLPRGPRQDGHRRERHRADRRSVEGRARAARERPPPVRADRRGRREGHVANASASRVYAYEKTLFDFDSKHITRPGNKLASEYLFNTYKSFGYTPEYQWFSPRQALGGQTANVVATLKGTVNPELVYVVSSHYDSVAIGPGADDDTSGTAALLETARIMAGHPMPATIVFASFTGEEAGLLGSREFVRRAVGQQGEDRRRAQQRHDRLGQRSPARQHDPLLEPGHPRHPARRGDRSSAT